MKILYRQEKKSTSPKISGLQLLLAELCTRFFWDVKEVMLLEIMPTGTTNNMIGTVKH